MNSLQHKKMPPFGKTSGWQSTPDCEQWIQDENIDGHRGKEKHDTSEDSCKTNA